ncbi:MAG: hypothetical protein UY44_C0014G0016 [Candidatus Kaiserbacteria bacterium GW2011_GWA2_49_19]|uniref:DUF6938 domain-containing protein n=1 Tax=Candidatus Kaiserbacteria bacterium GW2011_GWA2_49_19 TaxID=1618669 RepID=A0A0G1YPE2_9BACT|nr:MAG: hypothetical protein UY44_C0014G0016 [Candidatus Kaiserbacteria bacterium GW2011_GWA2_49_19]
MESYPDQKAWVVAVDMGYGHQRTAHNLRHLALSGQVINANNYPGLPEKDRQIWANSRKFYEAVSIFKRAPLIGNLVFSLFDAFQKVPPFYPKRDQSAASLSLRQIFLSLKAGWGEHLIAQLRKNPRPLISSFFVPAFMAEFFGYPDEIFCVVCDTDISRTWAALNIFLTGYPLPPENLGGEDLTILKEDLRHRLLNLDPQKQFFNKYQSLIKQHLNDLPASSNHPLTLMLAVGGAGAQKEIGGEILQSLKVEIQTGRIRLWLAAGTRPDVREYFETQIGQLSWGENRGIEILSAPTINDYFTRFNQALRQTDILWTKPSELSFYAALGLPLVIAPVIGSHEEFNKRWLLQSGFGVEQKEPKLTREWLFDLVEKGHLAEKAFEGFVEGEKLGTFKIQKIVKNVVS